MTEQEQGKRRFRLPRSLDAKILYMIGLALLCAGAVYAAVYGLGSLALERIYMSPQSVASRQAEIYADFSRYVTANDVSGSDADAVARWSGSNAYISIIIYQDNSLNLRAADGRVQPVGGEQSFDRRRYDTQYGKLYPMRFSDGLYYIAIGDSTQVREDNVNRVIAMVLAVVVFLVLMFWYVRRLTNRIIRLSREAGAIGAGDLDAPITVSGEDELAMLAGEMDAMRRSVIQRMSGERRAWEANSELITAISHDIRTPMTSLLGYLGLLNESGFADPARGKQFASSAYDKAMELKDLTDELFKYFLVFGRSDLELNMEEYDARFLLEQLLGEAEFDLSDAGFSVSRIECEDSCTVRSDPLYLKRVVDNLVSNIKKYADRDQPVLILTEKQGGTLSVCVSNTVSRHAPMVESTKIGLRTCEKIMEAMGGSFTTRREEDHFAAEFTLPVG